RKILAVQIVIDSVIVRAEELSANHLSQRTFGYALALWRRLSFAPTFAARRRIGTELAASPPGWRRSRVEIRARRRFGPRRRRARRRGAAARPLVSGASLVNRDGAALERLVVEPANRFFGLGCVIEFDKRKAARLTGLSIGRQMHVRERT